MRSSILDKLMRETPLETRIKVTVQAYYVNKYNGSFVIPLDKNGDEIPEVMEANLKCLKKAQPLVNELLKEIEQWKSDGCP